jgi:hypothetical protein
MAQYKISSVERKPKMYPSRWSTREVAYFAGMLSFFANQGVELLTQECSLSTKDGVLYFTDLIPRLEPFIPSDIWDECVQACERLFGGQ